MAPGTVVVEVTMIALLPGLAVAAPAGLRYEVAGRFEPGSTPSALRYVFDVQPPPPADPVVVWLGATPQADARPLVPVRAGARYTVDLADVPAGTGKLEVVVGDELHLATFAVREHLDTLATRPSADGELVLFTRPDGATGSQRLLIGRTEQPLDPLPTEVASDRVAGVWTIAGVDPDPVTGEGWQLTLATPGTTALYFLPAGSGRWRNVDTAPIDDLGLVVADFQGVGTWLAVTP